MGSVALKRNAKSAGVEGRTEDGVGDLAVRAARAALFYFGVVDLEEVVQPAQEFCARAAHRGKRADGGWRGMVVAEGEPKSRARVGDAPERIRTSFAFLLVPASCPRIRFVKFGLQSKL